MNHSFTLELGRSILVFAIEFLMIAAAYFFNGVWYARVISLRSEQIADSSIRTITIRYLFFAFSMAAAEAVILFVKVGDILSRKEVLGLSGLILTILAAYWLRSEHRWKKDLADYYRHKPERWERMNRKFKLCLDAPLAIAYVLILVGIRAAIFHYGRY